MNKISFKKKEAISKVYAILQHIILLIGIITSFGAAGLNVVGIMSGLGVSGVIFGILFKEIVNDFLSGLLIILYEPFKIGSNVKIDNFYGEVKDVNFRYTVLAVHEGEVLIPNHKLFTKEVTVFKKY